MEAEDTIIERSQTGIRILLSLLFVVIFRVTSVVLAVVVVFELLSALITRQPPSDRVRSFANRTLSYLYAVTRYLTYNQAEVPFPFSDFPREVEPIPPVELMVGTPTEEGSGPESEE
jgi:hypothetical protein